jgi:hypothetical protein
MSTEKMKKRNGKMAVHEEKLRVKSIQQNIATEEKRISYLKKDITRIRAEKERLKDLTFSDDNDPSELEPTMRVSVENKISYKELEIAVSEKKIEYLKRQLPDDFAQKIWRKMKFDKRTDAEVKAEYDKAVETLEDFEKRTTGKGAIAQKTASGLAVTKTVVRSSQMVKDAKKKARIIAERIKDADGGDDYVYIKDEVVTFVEAPGQFSEEWDEADAFLDEFFKELDKDPNFSAVDRQTKKRWKENIYEAVAELWE